MSNRAPSWQSTVIALALIFLVGAIFIVVYCKDGIDPALKAWAAIGTILGVITGAVPVYFFGQQQATEARQTAERSQEQAAEERQRRDRAEEKASLVLGYASEDAVEKAAKNRPDLFGKT